MLNINKLLYKEWEHLDVKYCHWKSNEHLDEGLDGLTDMDVIVHEDYKNICTKVLKDLKFINTKPQQGSIYPGVEEWIGFDSDTGKLVHLHLHYNIVTGKKHVKEYTLPVDEILLNTRIKDPKNDIYISDPNIEIIILYSRMILKSSYKLYLKALLGKFKIPNDYKVEIEFLKQQVNIKNIEELCNKIFLNYSNDIVEIIKKDEISSKSFIKLNKILRREFKKNRRMSPLKSTILAVYHKLSIKLKHIIRFKFDKIFILKKTFKNCGIDITLLGSDGAGKSTLSKDLIEWLSWKLECKSFYLGSGDHYITPYSIFVKFINRKAKKIKYENIKDSKVDISKTKKNTNKTEINKSNIIENSFIKKLYDFFNMYYLLNIAKRCYKQLYKSKQYVNEGGIAIYDRFPQNQYKGINDGPKISFRYSKYNKSLIYKYFVNKEEEYIRRAMEMESKLVFKLLVPPEVSIQRKPDHSYEEVAKKSQIIKSLEFNNSMVIKIDATQDYDQELLEVKNIIWNYIIKQLY